MAPPLTAMPGIHQDRRAFLAGGSAVLLMGGVRRAWPASGATLAPRPGGHPGSLEAAFAAPPDEAGPGAYWYWLDGAVTREGISADLEAMHANGITLAILFAIGSATRPPLVDPPADALTPAWWALVEHAVAEAERLGITLGLNACDGWATASGPWVEPAHSMQVLTWSEARAEGGRPVPRLPDPPRQRDWYRDEAVFAFPWPAALDLDSTTRRPAATTTLPLAGPPLAALLDPGNTLDVFDTTQAGHVDLDFGQPFTLRSVTVRTPSPWGYSPGIYRAANSLRVLASDDGLAWRPVGQLEYPRHGWQTGLNTLTHAVPETSARHFRLEHVPEASGPYREDYDFGQDVRLRVRSVVLSASPAIHHVEGKNASQWAISRRTTAAEAPDAVCVDPARLLDLGDRLRPDGTLDWQPPAGRWRILRIGVTTNGRENSAAGGAQGLEVDRFDAAAVTAQFEHWFGEALRRVGSDRAGRVLRYLHVDSWEASGQNWSAGMPGQFERLRGYALRPWLPVLAGVPVASAERSEQVLHDLRRTVADLTQSEFFGTLATLAHARGCLFSGEPASPTYVVDGLRYGEAIDLPMGEFWLRTPRNDKPTDVADAVSTAHLHGRRVAATESFTENEIRWDEHPGLLKPLGDHHYCRGVNRFLLHVYTAQPFLDRAPGMTLFGIGTPFSRTQTWWRQARGWFDSMRRCQAVLQQGMPMADVAVFTGEELPSRAWLPGLLEPALPEGIRFDSIDRATLAGRASVRDGRLVLPDGMEYRLLLVPGKQRYGAEVLAALERLARAGLWIHAAPAAGPVGLEHDRERHDALALQLWGEGGPAGERRIGRGGITWGAPPARLVERLGIEPAFASSAGPSLDWTHRAGPGWRTWFLANTQASPLAAHASLRGEADWVEAWWPVTGERQRLAARPGAGGRTEVRIELPPHGSVFLVARTPRRQELRRQARASALARRRPRAALPAPLDLPGPWSLRFSGWRAPADTLALERPTPWSSLPAHAVRHHAGTGHYATRFDIEPAPLQDGLRAWLELGEVRELAEVLVNGASCGTCWTAPWRIEISPWLHEGTNTLEIAVTNTWHNRLVGDRALPEGERVAWVYPRLRGGKEWLPAADAPLLPSGLAGPVRITWEPPLGG